MEACIDKGLVFSPPYAAEFKYQVSREHHRDNTRIRQYATGKLHIHQFGRSRVIGLQEWHCSDGLEHRQNNNIPDGQNPSRLR